MRLNCIVLLTETGNTVTIQAYYQKGACEILRRIIGKRVKVPYGPAAVYAEQGSISHWETGKTELL
ncbi:MAG: hypothetical protein PWP53_825 [Lacrimispora sp.]|jgi:hypothetical protein|nr:hypothetical protein [Lacrimispora sp.]